MRSGNAFHTIDEFLEAYKERFQPRYGFLRPIIREVVEKFLECGDLARGFARNPVITARRTACWPSPARAAGSARPVPAPTRRAKRPSIRGSTTLPRLRYRTGHGVLRHLKRPAAPKYTSRTPCLAAPQPSGGSCDLTSGPTFVTLRPWKRTLSASHSGPTPRRAKSDFLSVMADLALTAGLASSEGEAMRLIKQGRPVRQRPACHRRTRARLARTRHRRRDHRLAERTARAPHCQDPLARTTPIRGVLTGVPYEGSHPFSVRRFVTMFSGVLSVWRRRSASFVERHRGACHYFCEEPS